LSRKNDDCKPLGGGGSNDAAESDDDTEGESGGTLELRGWKWVKFGGKVGAVQADPGFTPGSPRVHPRLTPG
jgi:hypothetical protein